MKLPKENEQTASSRSPSPPCCASLKRFVGFYPRSGTKFSCYVVAPNWQDAEKKMRSWRVGAEVDGDAGKCSGKPILPGGKHFDHWIIYYAWIAASAGLLDLVDALADDGLIHELMHLHEGAPLVAADPIPKYLEIGGKLGFWHNVRGEVSPGGGSEFDQKASSASPPPPCYPS